MRPSKFIFELDSEDEMDEEVDNNLAALSGAAGRLNALAELLAERWMSKKNTLIESSRRHVFHSMVKEPHR